MQIQFLSCQCKMSTEIESGLKGCTPITLKNLLSSISVHFSIFHYIKMFSLTPVSQVYSLDPPKEQTAASLSLLVDSLSDAALSGVRGLMSELKSE